MKKQTCIVQTYSGIGFDILNPVPEKILIPDIAHSLSLLCRFTGHSRVHYSVAQHSILCQALAPENCPSLRLACLLHDSQEYLISDLPTPFKRLFPRYKKIEKNLTVVIAKKFNISLETFKETKLYDRMALSIESNALMGPLHPIWKEYDFIWPEDYEYPYELSQIKPMSPQEAEQEYLKTFNELWLSR